MKVIRFLLKSLIIAIAVLTIAAAASFAVSNRMPVAISLWPLPFATSLPLGITILCALAVGLIIGTALMSLSRLRLYFRARRTERRAAALERSAGRYEEAERAPKPPGAAALPLPSSRPALGDS